MCAATHRVQKTASGPLELGIRTSQHGCCELKLGPLGGKYGLLTTEILLWSLHAFVDVDGKGVSFPSLCHLKLVEIQLQLLLLYYYATFSA